MKTNTKTKNAFDAVDLMRSIREKVSEEIKGMTFEQEKNYLKKKLRSSGKESHRCR